MLTMTHDYVAQAWLSNVPSLYNNMWTDGEGDLYSYEQLIGRQYEFHNTIQVLLLKTWPTKATQKHLAAARRELESWPDATIYLVEDIEAAHDRWINGMFDWVEETVNSRFRYFTGTGSGIRGVIPSPEIDMED